MARRLAGEIAYLRLPRVLRKQPALHEFGELESLLTSSGILKSWNDAIVKRGHASTPASRQMDAEGGLWLSMHPSYARVTLWRLLAPAFVSWRKEPCAANTHREVESDPLGREQCAGEPFLGRWSSPRFIRHSGLADTAHRTDCRVEPLFTNVGSTSVDHPPALQAGF